jgi:hypothetical protein
VNVTGTVSESTSGRPVTDARIAVVSEQIELAVLYSGEAGRFSYSDSVDRIGETIVIRLSKSGYEDQEIVYHVDSDPLEPDVELIPVDQEWTPAIPLWLGLEERRRLFLIGSIIYAVVLFIPTIIAALAQDLGGTLLLLLVHFAAVPAYAITVAALVKGFLVPIVNGGVASILFAVLVAASNEDAGAVFAPFASVLLGHLVVGGLTVLIARAVWRRQTEGAAK